jgi:hypothetical protein
MTASKQLLAGIAVLVVIRAGLAFLRLGPENVADEIGYLTNARLLAGGIRGEMVWAPFYHGGYSLLLAPLIRLDFGPVTTYRLILVMNALLAASLLPLLYLLLTRSFGLQPRAALWAALAAAAYPSVTVWSQMAMPENLLAPLTVGWLLLLGTLVRARSQGASVLCAAAVAGVAVAAWAAHGRMIILVPLTAVALVGLALRGRLGKPALAAALGCLLVGILAARRLEAFLIAENYAGRVFHEFARPIAAIASLDGLRAVGRNLVGHTWYLLVATLGLVALFLMAEGWRGLMRGVRREGEERDMIVLLVLATTAGLLAISVMSFPVLGRSHHLVYGRYLDPVTPALIAVSLARLMAVERVPRLRWLLAGLALATLGVAALRAASSSTGAQRQHVASLPFVTDDLAPWVLVGAGAVAAAAIGLFAFLARTRPAAIAPVALGLFALIAAYSEHDAVLATQRSLYPAGWTSPREAAERYRIKYVGYDMDHRDRTGIWIYQWFLPHTQVVRFWGSRDRSPTRHVISSKGWQREHPADSATVVWMDPGRDQALWRLSR